MELTSEELEEWCQMVSVPKMKYQFDCRNPDLIVCQDRALSPSVWRLFDRNTGKVLREENEGYRGVYYSMNSQFVQHTYPYRSYISCNISVNKWILPQSLVYCATQQFLAQPKELQTEESARQILTLFRSLPAEKRLSVAKTCLALR